MPPRVLGERMKKRILFIGEASSISTGFGNYFRELIPRLHATGKYEIAEIGSYAKPNDPSVQEFIRGRWKFYYAWPSNEAEMVAFQQPSQHPKDRGANINQFGAHIFDLACAEFKPDIVISIRDWWMDYWIERSPFRSFFKWLWMPTVDSLPQAEEWIETYETVDLCLGYSDFGIHQLKQQSPKIKVFPKPMRPPVDLDTFKPLDKSLIRDEFHLSGNIPIIGTVVRNQSRKLILDLIDAFAILKKKYSDHDLVEKSVLLLHTSWPDNQYSFNYPRHINRLSSMKWLPNYCPGLRKSILQTYMCHECGGAFVGYAVNLHNRPITSNMIMVPCSLCGKNSASCPTTGKGMTRSQLAKIYNLLDIYVQSSIAEGDGMPINEAKACGVPTLVTDWSAMSEKGRFPGEFLHIRDGQIKESDYTVHLGGDVINLDGLRHEPETGCFRAVVDREDMADKIFNWLENKDILQDKAKQARRCAVDNYDADELSKRWAWVVDNVKVKNRENTWDTPIVVKNERYTPFTEVPSNLNDEEFVEWLYLNILKYTSVDFNGKGVWIQNLHQGVPRQNVYDQFVNIAKSQTGGDLARQKIRAKVAQSNNEPYVIEGDCVQETEEWI